MTAPNRGWIAIHCHTYVIEYLIAYSQREKCRKPSDALIAILQYATGWSEMVLWSWNNINNKLCCFRKYPYPSDTRFFLIWTLPDPLGISVNLSWEGYLNIFWNCTFFDWWKHTHFIIRYNMIAFNTMKWQTKFKTLQSPV